MLRKNNTSDELTFYLNIIYRNHDIPVIITNEKGKIIFFRNLYPEPDSSSLYLRGKLKEEFSVYPSIPIPKTGTRLYYKNSLVFNQLQSVLNDYISVFMSEITANSSNVPVIVTDSTQTNILQLHLHLP